MYTILYVANNGLENLSYIMTGYKNPGYKITVSVLSWSFLRNTISQKMGKHAAILILCCNSKCQFQLSIQYLEKENTWFFVFLLLKPAWFLLDKKNWMLQRWFSLSKSNYYDENNTGWLIIRKYLRTCWKNLKGGTANWHKLRNICSIQASKTLKLQHGRW